MDSAAIMMGDQTTVRLEVSQDKDKFVRLPIIQDTLVTGVEVLKVSKPDTIDLKNNRIQINNEVLSPRSIRDFIIYLRSNMS